MSTIPLGPQSADKASVDPLVLQKTDQAERDNVNRGYSTQNTVSTVTGQDEAQLPQASHRLDTPVDGAETPSEKVLKEISVYTEIKNHYSADPDVTGEVLFTGFMLDRLDPETLGGALERKNPLASAISYMQSNKEHLISLGYSEELIDGLLAFADPHDPNNSLASMHSFSAQMLGKLGGDDSLMELNELFSNIFIQIANLKDGPAELHAALQADLKAFNAAFLDSKKHIDVDSATLMLMSIQTKLQNNRLIFNQESIKANQVAREQASEKRMETILESIEKAKEAKRTGRISKIFGYITLAIMSVVMFLSFASGVGVAAGVLMSSAILLTMTMVISSETDSDFLNTGAAKMFEAFGLSEESAMMAATVFWSVLVLVLSGGAAVAGGLASTGTAAANAATNGAAAGASVTATATTVGTATARVTRLTTAAARLVRFGRISGGASMVGDGATSAVSTTLQYEADMLRVEDRKLYAFILHKQHEIDDMIEDIQKAMDELQQGYSVTTSILKDNHDTKTKLNGAIKG